MEDGENQYAAKFTRNTDFIELPIFRLWHLLTNRACFFLITYSENGLRMRHAFKRRDINMNVEADTHHLRAVAAGVLQFLANPMEETHEKNVYMYVWKHKQA